LNQANAEGVSRRKLRIVYLAGPGDVIGTYRAWAGQKDDPSQFAMTYSGQFYDLCRQLDVDALVISQHTRVDRLEDGSLFIQHRPNRLKHAAGLLYLLGLWYQSLRYVFTSIRFRADVVVASEGMGAWPPFRLLQLFGIDFVPSLMCLLWRQQYPPRGRLRRWLLHRDSYTFSKQATAVLSMSPEISRQVRTLSHGQPRDLVEFLPTYRRNTFADVQPPPAERSPFRVMFAGRIETFKGVFDLLKVAKIISQNGGAPVQFDLCGNGRALEDLKQQVQDAGLADRFLLHGHCDQTRFREILSQSHVLIAPTTSQFIEGFNQVVAEGVIAGRPVITSSICPAIELVRPAVVEVAPDDVGGYVEAILSLRNDQALYDRKRAACSGASEQFFDPEQSWKAALIKVLNSIARIKGITRDSGYSSKTLAV
jgi:glycosyltransferase involved in cell wall biosynthesis